MTSLFTEVRWLVIGALLWFATPAVYSQDADSEEGSKPEKTAPAEKSKPGNKKQNPNVAVGRVLETDNGIQLYAPRTMEMKFGMKLSSNENFCTGVLATMPFPLDWPEQKLTVLNNEIPDQARWAFRDLPAGARQLVLQMNSISPNSEVDLIISVQIEKSFINAPENTEQFRIPKTLSRELQWYMGVSPYIDTNLTEIRRTAKTIRDSKPENAWKHVEAIYDWVRDNIEYKNGDVRHIRDALKDKSGDCEEMTGIFVALCRASNVPARCVWIPEHCYPEFYLEDEEGNGHWFPCQAAGERQFGQMHDYRPILQKGDRFNVPEEKKPQRYVTHYLSCKQRPVFPGARDMEVRDILDLGALKEELEQLRADAALGGNSKEIETKESEKSPLEIEREE